MKELDMDLLWIDLQWFAAEEEGRTEDPTDQKVRKAREDGKVAKSSELIGAFSLLLPILTIGLLGNYMLSNFKDMLTFFLNQAVEQTIEGSRIPATAFLNYYVKLVWPVMAVAFVSAILGNVFQIGFLFSTKPITPDFSKIAPNFGKYFKRVLGSTEALFNLLKSILKIVLVGILAYINVKQAMPRLITLSKIGLEEAFFTVLGIGFRIFVEAGILMLVWSIPDFLFQRHQHRESLKMSKQEVKEEFKQSEGDPQIKGRLKERMRDILSKNMMRNVPEADVVITNPTHFAVALEWNRESMEAPMVVAKGQDNIAQRIKAIARENDVPIVENKPLARGLFAAVEIGDIIPPEYWEVVSVILAEIYRLNGKNMTVTG